MTIRVRAVLIALALLVQRSDSRVFLMSLDAVGHQRITTDPVARELETLQAILETGAYADGLTPAFPSTTANGHAALWTGTYAGRNGILYNQTPPLPRREHLFSDRINGFRSEALRAEPIWLTAARQSVSVVAHQVTQVVPFLPATVGSSPSPHLATVNGFQSRAFASWRLVRSNDADVVRTSCSAWPDTEATEAQCYEWALGSTSGVRIRARVLADRLMIAVANLADAVAAAPHPTETETPRVRALARYWSAPLAVDGLGPDIPARLVFRAFEIDPQSKSFVLLQSPLHETAAHSTDASLARAMVAATGPMISNGASGLYNSGVLGVQAYAGGSGEAERRYLETLEVVIKQQIAQSNWLFERRRPRLHISYLSTADDVDHTWYGLDRAGDARYVEFRRWGYMALGHAVRAFAGLAGPEDHVIFTSDHGMAPVMQLFAVDRVLADAGLSAVASTVSTCLLLNTTEWKGGTISPDKREATLERVRAALVAPRTSAGGPIVTKVYSTRAELAAFGHDGPGGADLCYDVAPGIGPSSEWSLRGGTGILSGANPSRGMHGFDPTRADMKAILLIRGPRASRRNLGPQPSTAVAPLVADLLGIDSPRDATARSPMR
jgi:Type I phosphodiesterase / nucleotide pyrophosphatase